MRIASYSRSIDLVAAPVTVYRALTEEIHKWWTTAADDASTVGKRATFCFDESYNTMLVRELVRGRRVVWLCLEENNADETLSVHDEWIGTRPIWDMEPGSTGGTRLIFVHHGLVPKMECYAICERAWDEYLVSLKKYLETGIGEPYQHANGARAAGGPR